MDAASRGESRRRLGFFLDAQSDDWEGPDTRQQWRGGGGDLGVAAARLGLGLEGGKVRTSRAAPF